MKAENLWVVFKWCACEKMGVLVDGDLIICCLRKRDGGESRANLCQKTLFPLPYKNPRKRSSLLYLPYAFYRLPLPTFFFFRVNPFKQVPSSPTPSESLQTETGGSGNSGSTPEPDTRFAISRG